MKKIILICLSCILLLGLTGCTGRVVEDYKIQVVTTIFPEYDWTRELAKGSDNVEVKMLIDSGVDLHSYQPTAKDILTISSCDVFIYVGGESDKWVEDALKESANEDMVVVNLMDVLGDKVSTEEEIEGMEREDEHGEDEEEVEYDEHVWLSLSNAKVCTEAIESALSKADPDNSEIYNKNLAEYTKKLDEIDGKYKEAKENGRTDTLIFGDRFPFRYMTDDYNLSYYAAFKGCSAETEASFETVRFLSQKIDELGLKNIITIKGSDQKLAKTIIDNTKDKNKNILTLDSMQSVTADDFKEGKTYLSIMEDNLSVLKTALEN